MTQAFNLSQLANGANTSGQLNASGYLYNQVPVANGGTALSSAGATGNMLIASSASAYSTVKMPTFSFRNRIINGDMRIDQRNAGAAVTAEGYLVDRWRVWRDQTYSIQQSSEAPSGFANSLAVTKTNTTQSNYAYLVQYVEGNNVADLGFGTASAATVTVSFWVKSSITGVFSVVLSNNTAKSYATTYTINAANTWEQKSVTIAGDTAGTWLKTNGVGIAAIFDFGGGASSTAASNNAWISGTATKAAGSTGLGTTNGATFYITGVQLEAGSVATAFDVRDYGRELMMCQRYYWANTSCIIDGYVRVSLDTSRFTQVFFPVPMRAAPSITQTWDGGSSPAVGGVTTYSYRASVVQGDTTTARVITSVTASAEL